MTKHEMPSFITAIKGDYHYYLEVESYAGHMIDVLDPSDERSAGEGPSMGETRRRKVHTFSRLNGRLLASWGGMLEGARLTPDSLVAVHPATFRADGVRQDAGAAEATRSEGRGEQ